MKEDHVSFSLSAPYGHDTSADDAIDFERRNTEVYLFLDRAIYRPGQTVYFKGIAVTKDFATSRPKVASDRPTTVVLYNANNERVELDTADDQRIWFV